MGFGLLFFGYFFTLNLPYKGIDILPDIVGCILMYIALKRLCGHCPDNKGFLYARMTLIPYSVFALAVLAVQIGELFVTIPDSVNQWLVTPVSVLYSIVIGAYHIFLLLGIHNLSKSVGLDKLATRAGRLIAMTAVYYFFQLLSSFGVFTLLSNVVKSPEIVMSYVNFIIYIVGFIWLILTWAIIFTCYMRICLEGDEDMPHNDDAFDKLMNRFKGKK